jgi:hypothetical protein
MPANIVSDSAKAAPPKMEQKSAYEFWKVVI